MEMDLIVEILAGGRWTKQQRMAAAELFHRNPRWRKEVILANLLVFVEEAACDYQDGHTDADNAASAGWAYAATETGHRFLDVRWEEYPEETAKDRLRVANGAVYFDRR
jgi:hypothetical protein